MKPEESAMLAVIVSGAAFLASAAAVYYARRSARASERQARAAEAAVPPVPPAVSWTLEHGHHGAYRLRNTGTHPAIGVRIQMPSSFNGQLFADFGDGTIPSRKAVDVRWTQAWKDPNLNEVPVIWAGQTAPTFVPVPPQPARQS